MTMPTWFAWFLVAWLIGCVPVAGAMLRQLSRPDLTDRQVLLRATLLAFAWCCALVGAVILGAP